MSQYHRPPHQLLQRVDEVLQVDVIPVRLDVAQKQVSDPVPQGILEDEGQDGCRQLQEEDKSDQGGELREEVEHGLADTLGPGLAAPPSSLEAMCWISPSNQPLLSCPPILTITNSQY